MKKIHIQFMKHSLNYAKKPMRNITVVCFITEEKDISLSADNLIPNLHVDDAKLKKIVDGLYYLYCPSMISTEILGNIYGQFLGKVIRLTERHYTNVEDKPEVKRVDIDSQL